ncbi:MAG: HIT family protein [Lentisphaeria bacterium]
MKLVDNCVFCKIIKGELPCCKLYEDDKIFVFLDIAPFNLGHALLIPKVHCHSITTLPKEYLDALIEKAPEIAAAVMHSTGADGFNLLLNNGSCAGQEVPHVHLHVIPRFTTDDNIYFAPKKKYDNDEEMNELADKIRSRLG